MRLFVAGMQNRAPGSVNGLDCLGDCVRFSCEEVLEVGHLLRRGRLLAMLCGIRDKPADACQIPRLLPPVHGFLRPVEEQLRRFAIVGKPPIPLQFAVRGEGLLRCEPPLVARPLFDARGPRHFLHLFVLLLVAPFDCLLHRAGRGIDLGRRSGPRRLDLGRPLVTRVTLVGFESILFRFLQQDDAPLVPRQAEIDFGIDRQPVLAGHFDVQALQPHRLLGDLRLDFVESRWRGGPRAGDDFLEKCMPGARKRPTLEAGNAADEAVTFQHGKLLEC